MAIYLFYDWRKFWACFENVEVAYGIGAICGVAAGLAWTFLFARSALRSREWPVRQFPLSRALAHGALCALAAWLLFVATFLAWSIVWGKGFSPLTGLILVVGSSIKWLLIGVIGGTAGWYALKR